MAKKKLTIDDIFNDDDFGLLESKVKTTTVKTDEDRLIDSFEEINMFFDKNNREPNSSSMSEYGLLAKLKNFRQNEKQKKTLKPFDRHNLLGFVEMEKQTIDDILNEINKMKEVYDEPFADSSALPSLLLNKVTKPIATVALSGDGGDESFLGYNNFDNIRKIEKMFTVPFFLRRLISFLPIHAELLDHESALEQSRPEFQTRTDKVVQLQVRI